MFATRWGALSELNRLGLELDRAFSRGGTRASRLQGIGVFPHMNLWEDGENYYAEAELPGYCKDEINLSVSGNQLTLKGVRHSPQTENGTWHRQERGFGSFSRTVELPSDVDGDKVSADYKNGVLHITLPKRVVAKPRRIEISTK